VPEEVVYQFMWSDRNGNKVVSPGFATSEAIIRCNGKLIEDTRLVVDSRQVDRNGFYSRPIR
jgi:hypothetical protein